MPRKTISFFMILILMLSIYSGGSALSTDLSASSQGDDFRLLKVIELDLEASHTSRAQVNMGPGQVLSVDFEDITGAFAQSGQIILSFIDNGIQRNGEYLEPDLLKHYHADTYSSIPIEKNATSVGADIGLDKLRMLVQASSETVVVAVLDTGVDIDHPSLKDRIVLPYDAADGDTVPEDVVEHGTHVAGIIAANTPSNVKIMPVKVFNEEGSASDSLIVKGIDYAVKNGAKVINMSLGGYGTTSSLDKAIDYAYSKGVIIIVSSGNEGHDMTHDYPAAFPEVITVGATGQSGDLLYFSNTGDAIDVCAPGEKIISSVPQNGEESKSGTSMSVPLVAAAVAMLLIENPERTIGDIETLIHNNTRDLGAPGKDELYGYGELAFSNYKTNADFYMITSGREATEEKFNMNLKFYAGDNVSELVYMIDGGIFNDIKVDKSGVNNLYLDIRSLSHGEHSLIIQPKTLDGVSLPTYSRLFTIPEYNVRIKVLDSYDRPVANPVIQMIGFSQQDKIISKVSVSSSVVNGIWRTNLDFERIFQKYDKIKFNVEASPKDGLTDIPLYFRVVGTSGEKTFEYSECSAIEFTSEDTGVLSGVAVTTRLLGAKFIGFNKNLPWGSGPDVFSIDMSSETIPFSAVHYQGKDLYAGVLYYDTKDQWLDAYSWRTEQSEGYIDPNTWYYSGLISEMSDIHDLGLSGKSIVNVKADLVTKEPLQYILVDIPSGSYIINTIKNGVDRIILEPGAYDFFISASRLLIDGREIYDTFSGVFDFTSEGEQDLIFGGVVSDQFGYDAKTKQILHRWVDQYGNDYSVVAQNKEGYDAFIPALSLSDEMGNNLTIEGEISGMNAGFTHSYSLSGVSDGIWQAEFINDSDILSYPVAQKVTQITITNGEVFYPGNTPPIALTDYISSMKPGSVFIYDLNDEFSDLEQSELEFHTTNGWIVDGYFYYRDLIGEDIDIIISAFDGQGGMASFKHSIRISDKSSAENEYMPNPDIDSIGATSWAISYIQKAILADIVPVDLLDLYQSNISRLEFSTLIVQMAEKFLGPIKLSPNVSFKDTRNEAILKAASLNFLSGSNGYFNPYEELSRQQFCVIVYQIIKVIRPDLAKPVKSAPQFRDTKQIASWAKEAVDYCYAHNIMVGSNGIANPTGKLSREQAILMLYKAFEICQ